MVVWSLVIVLLLAAGSPPLQACDGGTAVPDPENNSGLVADCRVLLGLRDELAGTESLNWDTGLSITDWQIITVSGSPSRVTELELSGRGLTGAIPHELGQLSQLQYLSLHLCCNQLQSGAIPAELGQLSQLRVLVLENNRLSGKIPYELGQLSQLQAVAPLKTTSWRGRSRQSWANSPSWGVAPRQQPVDGGDPAPVGPTL